jgi:hypothetical protein
MRRSRPLPSFILTFIIVSVLFLVSFLTVFSAATPVSAQCGTSASSCKSCHEVNAKAPVNNVGAWHTSHAFGDFCSFCHGGNVQAVDQKEAHQGMFAPVSDPKGSCQSCHADDYLKKAEVYALALGAKLPSGGTPGGSSTTSSAPVNATTNATSGNVSDLNTGGSTASTAPTGSTGANANAAECKPIDPPGEFKASGPLIDYNQRYNVEALGQIDPTQTGNVALIFAAVLLTLGGGALVWHFEGLSKALREIRAESRSKNSLNSADNPLEESGESKS